MATASAPSFAATMPPVLWAYLFWGVLVGGPLSVVCVALGLRAESAIAHTAALPRAATHGPALHAGTLGTRDARTPEVTPMGVPVAGWDAEVQSAIRMGKSTHTTVLCHRQQVDAMVLRGSRGWALPITLLQPDLADGAVGFALGFTRSGASRPIVRGETVRSPSLPAGFACPLPPLQPHETRTYVERRLPLGATATFLGCNAGGLLTPCPNDPLAAGHLALGPPSTLIGSLLIGALVSDLLLVVVVFFSLMAATVVAVHLRRYLRTAGEAW